VVSFCFKKRCLPLGVLIGWYKLSVPNRFLVIRLLAKSRLGISFCTSRADETSYVSLLGKRLSILISKEKVVRRKKLHEFNILVEHKGMYMLLGVVWVLGFCRGPC
jgi:hypothetical protein